MSPIDMQDQLIDLHVDIANRPLHLLDIRRASFPSHAQPPISDSVKGFSSLANSTRAARSR